MAEIVLPQSAEKDLEDILEEFQVIQVWLEKTLDKWIFMKLLLAARKTQAVLDVLEKRFSTQKAFRIILLPVEAALTRPESEQERAPQQCQTSSEEAAQTKTGHIICS